MSEEFSYERLYESWEEEHWGANAIDFTIDAEHWRSRLSERQRESALWNYTMFLAGVETQTRALPAMLDAARRDDERALFATQAADAARHRVFLDRWLREVTGHGDDSQSTLAAARDHATWGFRQILSELDQAADSLRKRPNERPLLAAAIALSHIVIEGVLAVPGGFFINRYLEKEAILPGLSTGLGYTQRDEARHVAFGQILLADLIRSSRECRAAAVAMWDRTLAPMVGVFIPPGGDASYIECFDFSMHEVYAFGLKTFESKIRRVGVDPEEIFLLARDDRSLTYDDRARRLLVLISSGVLGDDTREPQLSQEAFEILFEAMARAVDVEVAASVEGPIEWDFTDAEPWHLIVVDGHVEAKPGRAGTPGLRLELSSADWARIAVGRFDPRWALLRRRMRVHGSLSAKAKLSKLFH
jgi:hypothetical protein